MTESVEKRCDSAATAINLGRLAEAEQNLRALLSECPRSPRASCLLAEILASTDRVGEGIEILQAAATTRSLDVELRLVDLHRRTKDLTRALQHARRAVILADDNPNAFAALGSVQADLEQYDDAIRSLRAAIKFDPEQRKAIQDLGRCVAAVRQKAPTTYPNSVMAGLCDEYGTALCRVNRHDEAIGVLQHALALDPQRGECWGRLGDALAELGRFPEADAAYETALQLKPRFVNALFGQIRLRSDKDRRLKQLQVIREHLHDAENLTDRDVMLLNYSAFKVLEDLEQFDDAFSHLLAANRTMRRSINYDEASALGLMRRMREVTRELVQQCSSAGCASNVPIFIVGMPRSGTTLVEQILASHDAVWGGGESKALAELAFKDFRDAGLSQSFPKCVSVGSGNSLAALGNLYVKRLTENAPPSRHVTDKMPENYLLLGLIHLALPKAKIIAVRRDPRDVCLSCFSMPFTGNLNYAYDLAELGRHYRAYSALMAHWRDALPSNAFLEVVYEDLVSDLEGQARRMLQFCSLPWNSRVLSFYETARPVRTASFEQVRRPIFASSIGRWRRYSQFLAPLLDELEKSPQSKAPAPKAD